MSSPAPESDEELARRAAGGDRAALGELMRRYWKRLAGFLRDLGVPPGEVDDLIQEVWLKVFRHAGKWDGNFAWVKAIATNTMRDWRKKRRLSIASDAEVVELVDPHRVAEPDALARFRHCWGLLAEGHQAVLAGRADGESYEELAAMLGINVGTVKSRLSRGREELKDCLGPYAE